MAQIKRHASAKWQGSGKDGSGNLTTQSGTLKEAQYSFSTRFENGVGTNPEQLFAAGYSACFIGAMKAVAAKQKLSIPSDVSITGSVGIGPIPTGFALAVELKISLPGMDRAAAQDLIDKAHVVCPYSNATRGNVDVRLVLA